MKKTILLTMVLLAGCNSNEPETSKVISNPPPEMNNGGYTVNIDPATGEFLPSPPPKTAPNNSSLPQASSKVQTDQSQQPEIIPSDVPGGGDMIKLKGRFMPHDQDTPPSDQ
jgi:hypothetical protein